MKANFKTLTFKSQEELDLWLKENTSYILFLVDNGQDMQTIWVHHTGEILQTDFSSSIYVGRFVDVNRIKAGKPLFIKGEDETVFTEYGRLVVESVSKTV